jgi:hypothetical protein
MWRVFPTGSRTHAPLEFKDLIHFRETLTVPYLDTMSARRPRRPAVHPEPRRPMDLLRVRPLPHRRRGCPRRGTRGERADGSSSWTRTAGSPADSEDVRPPQGSSPSPDQTGALHKYLHVSSARSVSEGDSNPNPTRSRCWSLRARCVNGSGNSARR